MTQKAAFLTYVTHRREIPGININSQCSAGMPGAAGRQRTVLKGHLRDHAPSDAQSGSFVKVKEKRFLDIGCKSQDFSIGQNLLHVAKFMFDSVFASPTLEQGCGICT